MRAGLLILALGLLLASCSPPPARADAVIIGAVVPLSGEFAPLGRSLRSGLELALDLAAPGGTVSLDGRTVRIDLRVDDDRGDAVAGETAVRRLAEQRSLAIIAGVQSSVALAASRAAQDTGTILLVPSATDPAVTEGRSTVFRVCFDDRQAGAAMAVYAFGTLGARRAALLYDRTASYNTALAAAFAQRFRSLGGRVVAEQGFDDERRRMDFRPILAGMRPLRPQVLFSPNYYRATAEIAVQARQLGLGARVLSGEGANSPDLALLGGEAVEGVAYPVHLALDDASRVTRQFRDQYRRAYGHDPDAFAALGHDAMRLVLAALRRAGTADAQALRDALGAIEALAGATGTLSFKGPGNPRREVIIVRIRGGRPVFHARIRP